jgi:hypothetical protein
MLIKYRGMGGHCKNSIQRERGRRRYWSLHNCSQKSLYSCQEKPIIKVESFLFRVNGA